MFMATFDHISSAQAHIMVDMKEHMFEFRTSFK